MTARAPSPLLRRMTVCGAAVLPTLTVGVSRVGVSATAGAKATPLKDTSCWLPATLSASSVRIRLPLRTPVVAGAKVTRKVQLSPAKTTPGQLFVCR